MKTPEKGETWKNETPEKGEERKTLWNSPEKKNKSFLILITNSNTNYFNTKIIKKL